MKARDPRVEKVLRRPHAGAPGLQRLRSRAHAALDALMTTSLREDRQWRAILGALFGRSAGYRRISALLQVVDRVLPGTARRVTSLLCRPGGLPFDPKGLELIGVGAGGTVFRFESEGRTRCLKLYRKTLGRDRETLSAAADFYRARHALACDWYRDCHLVNPTEYLVLSGPLLGIRGVGACQEFLEGPLLDLFETPIPEAIEKSRSHPELGEQIVAFARRTEEIRREHQAGIDLVGHENCNLVRVDGRWQLRLIDFGYIDFEGEVTHPETRLRADRARRDHLTRLVEALTKTGQTDRTSD